MGIVMMPPKGDVYEWIGVMRLLEFLRRWLGW